MRTAQADFALSHADGVIRWTEHVHGGTAFCRLDARLLARVLRAREAYFANKPRLKYTAPTLRLVKPVKGEKTA